MAKNAVFYHAGCSVCVDAQRRFVGALDPAVYAVEVVHLGETPEAEAIGVKSVPAIVMEGAVYHINHGADLSALS